MVRYILSLALLLSAEWVTCENELIQPEVEQLIITQDTLLNRLGILETNFLEYQYKLQSKLDTLEVENSNLITLVATLEKKNEKFLDSIATLEEKNANWINLVATLVKKVEALEQMSDFSRGKSSKEIAETNEGKGSYVPRSCQDLKSVDPSLPSGSYLIDPDGVGVGDAAIFVFCDMLTGKTFVTHDTETTTTVPSCSDPGCYSKAVTYNATAKQIAALIDISATCRQYFKYECLGAPLETNDIHYSFWNDRNGKPQYFWAGNQPNPPDTHTCQCGISGNCVDNLYKCNCDAMAPSVQNDNGYITAMSLLPVTKLNFGHTQLIGASGKHTLGQLECSGSVVVSGKPSSCLDLFKIGHTLKGIYQVKGIGANVNKIETIYCDFEQQPSSASYETRLGFNDVKTSSVHFYVQRNTGYTLNGTIIPWELARLNVGNAMNTTAGVFTAPHEGVYHFSYSGIKDNIVTGINTRVQLRLNGGAIGIAIAATTDGYHTASLQATLQLKKGDRIELWLLEGKIYDNSGTHYVHFTGWMDEEVLIL